MPTHAPNRGSPLINAGGGSAHAVDASGEPPDTLPDIGAHEYLGAAGVVYYTDESGNILRAGGDLADPQVVLEGRVGLSDSVLDVAGNRMYWLEDGATVIAHAALGDRVFWSSDTPDALNAVDDDLAADPLQVTPPAEVQGIGVGQTEDRSSPPSASALVASLTLVEGGDVLVDGSVLDPSDDLAADEELTWHVDTLPANGTFMMGGSVVDAFSHADVLAGRVLYRHDGGETTSDGATLFVDDGTNSSGPLVIAIEETVVVRLSADDGRGGVISILLELGREPVPAAAEPESLPDTARSEPVLALVVDSLLPEPVARASTPEATEAVPVSEAVSSEPEERTLFAVETVEPRPVFFGDVPAVRPLRVASIDLLDPVRLGFAELAGAIERQQELLEQRAGAVQALVGASVGVTSGLSVGYLVWLIRGGTLLGGVLSSLPAWRFVDPLPVLDALAADDDDGESLESIVAAETTSRPSAPAPASSA